MKTRSVWKGHVSLLNGDCHTFSGNHDYVRSTMARYLDQAFCGAIWCRELNGKERFTNIKQIFRSVDCRYIFFKRADGSIKWHECGK